MIAAFMIGAVEVPLLVGPSSPRMLGPYALDVVLVPFVRRVPQVAAVLGLVFLAPPALTLAAAARSAAHRRNRRRRTRQPGPQNGAVAGSGQVHSGLDAT